MKQITIITTDHVQLLFWLFKTPYHLKWSQCATRQVNGYGP